MSDTETTAATETTSLRDFIQAEYDKQAGAGGDVGNTDATTEGDTSRDVRDDGRDERGRFAKKESVDDAKGDGNEQPGSNDGRDAKLLERADRSAADTQPDEGDHRGNVPPPGWSVASKAAWNELPEAVKADIAKREQEVSNGFKQYQGLGELKPYAEAYQRNGQTIKQAFDGYINIEKALQTNFVGGVAQICQGFNVSPVALAQEILRQAGQGGQEQAPDPIRDALSPLQREIEALKAERDNERRAAQQREQQEGLSQITAFASDPKHTYFENVKQTMGHLIATGQAGSMEDAYDKAIWMHPEIRPLLLKQQQAEAASANQTAQRQAAAAQARQSARSITGSPAPGGSSAARPSASRSIREIAEEAARAQGVAL